MNNKGGRQVNDRISISEDLDKLAEKAKEVADQEIRVMVRGLIHTVRADLKVANLERAVDGVKFVRAMIESAINEQKRQNRLSFREKID